MAKKQINRASQEANEEMKQVKVDAPDTRFQDDQQVTSAIKAGSNNAPDESFIPKKLTGQGHVLRQEVAAEVVKGAKGSSAGGVATPSTYGLREMSFSGDAGTILGNASGTPTLAESAQGKSRLDKRLSDANKDINYNASEQVHVEYHMIPALAESDSTVGYNGNPKNAAVRSQKNTGLTPAEELYDRSLDIITKDVAVFTSGQRVEQEGVDYHTYPTKTAKDLGNGAVDKNADFTVNKGPVSGNFMPHTINVTIAKTSGGTPYVKKFEVQEIDLSANNETSAVVNASSTNGQIDRNKSELVRQTIDANAGSPTQKGFNPLGRSVQQPTQTVTYLRDIEASTGATVYAAYKFAQKARGHYLNRTAKDGQTILDPAVDALYGGLTSARSMQELYDIIGTADEKSPLIFNARSNNAMAKGSAALMLAIFDSTSKYKTKADIVNQPRGLKMHLQTADNNMNVFRCKSEFVAALNSVDAYSSIDKAYDPMSPVYVTDNFKLIYPYSWRRALEFHRDSPTSKIYDSEVLQYYYAAGAGQNAYLVKVGDPVLNGIAYFLDLHVGSIANALNVSNGQEQVLTIPVVHSTTHFSLWDYLVCAATPYIIYERTNSLKDILDYEMNFDYPFSDLVKIQDANPMNAVNYGNPSALLPLEIKQMLPSSAIRWKYPEMLYPLGAGAYLLPFYFSERDVRWNNERTANAAIMLNGCENFSSPIIRDGVKLSGLDSFFDMEIKDQILNFDVMTRMPGLAQEAYVKGGVYKYAQGSDGIPFVLDTDDVLGEATIYDYMATPRQLGWFFDLPAGVGSAVPTEDGADYFDPNHVLKNMFDMGPSYKATMYKGGLVATEAPTDILGKASLNVNRAQAFVQNWHSRYASRFGGNESNFDLMLSPLDGFDYSDSLGSDVHIIAKKNKTAFRPLVIGSYINGADNTVDGALGNSADNYPLLFSIMRIYWAVMQKLPFIINPFAAFADNDTNVEGYVDPFDIAHLFGLSGFAAANYYEEVFNRANQVLNQGYGFTNDPLVAASPVFKDSYRYTQIG